MTNTLAPQPYQDCIEACLSEQDVMMMVNCIRLDRDCAKICYTAVSFMASGSSHAADVCKLCAHICEACAEECEKHAVHFDHCKQCAEACRTCAEACHKMARAHTRWRNNQVIIAIQHENRVRMFMRTLFSVI